MSSNDNQTDEHDAIGEKQLQRLREAEKQLQLYADEANDARGHDLAKSVERLRTGDWPTSNKKVTDGGIVTSSGSWLRNIQHETHKWRLETIGDDVTPLSQAAHASVEASEVLDLLVKAETYDNSWVEENEEALMEEIGDVVIALAGVPSLLDIDLVECVEAALEKNDVRQWDGWQTQVADWDGEAPADD